MALDLQAATRYLTGSGTLDLQYYYKLRFLTCLISPNKALDLCSRSIEWFLIYRLLQYEVFHSPCRALSYRLIPFTKPHRQGIFYTGDLCTTVCCQVSYCPEWLFSYRLLPYRYFTIQVLLTGKFLPGILLKSRVAIDSWFFTQVSFVLQVTKKYLTANDTSLAAG